MLNLIDKVETNAEYFIEGVSILKDASSNAIGNVVIVNTEGRLVLSKGCLEVLHSHLAVGEKLTCYFLDWLLLFVGTRGRSLGFFVL